MFFQKLTINLSKNLDRVARIIFLLIMFLVVGNVISRQWGYPLNGCYELVGLLMALAVSFSLAYCAFQGGHVALTFLVERLKPRPQLILEIITEAFILIFLGMVVKMIFIYGQRMFFGGQIGMNTKIPLYYLAYAIAFGFLGYCLLVLTNLLKKLRKMIKR